MPTAKQRGASAARPTRRCAAGAGSTATRPPSGLRWGYPELRKPARLHVPAVTSLAVPLLSPCALYAAVNPQQAAHFGVAR